MSIIKAKAVAYWQDNLAKFFPNFTGPTSNEVIMYKAGLKEGLKTAQRVGEILQTVASNIPPKYTLELRDIFKDVKEMLDE